MRIVDPNYIPSNADILHVRIKRSGVYETRLTEGDLSIHLSDFGVTKRGIKNVSRYFGNLTSIIFVVDLAIYDQVPSDGSFPNGIAEPLAYFESVVNSREVRDTSIILFLGNVGKFRRKLQVSPFAKYFPDYNRGIDGDEAEYIVSRFKLVNHAHLDLYGFVVEPHDASIMRLVFSAVRDTLSQNAYRTVGLLEPRV